MPELPEVETVCRGITPHLQQQTITQIIVRQPQLRWPIQNTLLEQLPGQVIQSISRRAKYILLQTTSGTLLIHLGMSGSLRILAQDTTRLKHDHVDIILANKQCLRFNDPRRFGALLWTTADPSQHPLLINLGPEPLKPTFDATYLYQQSQRRTIPIKTLLMDSRIVVGIGNIYANEALFLAKIHPQHPAKQLSKAQCEKLSCTIKQVLNAAILQGGTTLRNFVSSEGKPGYFKQQLYVYGRGGQNCKNCAAILIELKLSQRTTVFCPHCQQQPAS